MGVQTPDTSERPDAYEAEEFRAQAHRWWVPWLTALVVAASVVAVGSYFVYGRDSSAASMAMGGDSSVVPVVRGLYDGQEIHFLHTEASDPQIAGMLSEMMASPVIVVRALSDVPDGVLGNVYAFTNGVRPDEEMERGPFGFQSDVFDSVPGDTGYTPLRAVNAVTWQDERQARLLGSVEEIEQAEAAGELTVERVGAVVNMPIVDWPGGER
jgi:hypothetical protein